MKPETNPEVLKVFKALLGLEEPWRIKSVSIEEQPKRVDIEIEWPSGHTLVCPECGKACATYDHAGTRWWRHLDTMGHLTRLCCRTPRCECPEHGVRTVRIPWAGEGSRFTEQFECRAIDLELAASSQKQAGQFLRISWWQAHCIQVAAVKRGLARREIETIKRVGIDEKSFGKGQHYGTLVSDLDGHCVLEVVEHRDEQSAARAFESLGKEQLKKIEAVAMDMWAPYMKAAALKAPNAAIVHDRYHVSAHLNEAVDSVRKEEHAQLSEQANEWLKGKKYLFLKSPESWRREERDSFRELRKKDLKVTKAWGMRENFRHFWEFEERQGAQAFFEQWEKQAQGSGLGPMKKKAAMMREHLPGLLNYARHRITNAVSEGFNAKIQVIKSAARGFRCFGNYRTAILFHCGKLSLHPL